MLDDRARRCSAGTRQLTVMTASLQSGAHRAKRGNWVGPQLLR